MNSQPNIMTYYQENGKPLDPDTIDCRLKLYDDLLSYLCNRDEMPASPRFEQGEWIIETEHREKRWTALTPHVEIIAWICRTYDDGGSIPY